MIAARLIERFIIETILDEFLREINLKCLKPF